MSIYLYVIFKIVLQQFSKWVVIVYLEQVTCLSDILPMIDHWSLAPIRNLLIYLTYQADNTSFFIIYQ